MNINDYINLPLEQTVQFLLDKVAAHYGVDRVLAEFGITILGKFNHAPTEPGTAYGDAYLVGTEEPYDIYIWTRNGTSPGVDGWFNIGPLNVRGPEGPVGPQGIQGIRGESTKWRSGVGYPTVLDSDQIHDLYLDFSPTQTKGNVYQLSTSRQWGLIGNIIGPQGPQGNIGPKGDTGPQGPQGIQGPQGDVGGFINIYGVVPNRNQMLSPGQLNNLTYAYLVGTAVPYDLYIQVGENVATAYWLNTGPLNVSTLVSVNGEYVNIWDADTKVDKITPYNAPAAITVRPDGSYVGYTIYGTKEAYTLAYRETGGVIRVGTAVGDDDAVPYAQFKSAIDALQAQIDAITPSKNLFRSDFVEGDSISSDAEEIEVYGEGGTYETTLPFKQICPNCIVGKTYTISSSVVSAQADGGDQLSPYNLSISAGSGNSWFNIYANENQTFTLTQAIADSKVMFDLSYYSGEWGPEYSRFIIKIMLNEGNTALPWEPAIK